MNRIIEMKVDEGHYQAHFCLVWCFDDRFSGLLAEFIKKHGNIHVDLVKAAGGAKDIADPDDALGRDYLLRQIEGSIKLHHTKTIGLMVHANCGAYGAPKFETPEAEHDFYKGEVERAAEVVRNFLKEKNLEAAVECYVADFKGLVALKA